MARSLVQWIRTAGAQTFNVRDVRRAIGGALKEFSPFVPKLMQTLNRTKELLDQLTATSPKLPATMPMPPGVECRVVDQMQTYASGEPGTMLQRQHARRVVAIGRQDADLPVYAEVQGQMVLVGQDRINGVPIEARLSDERGRELLPARSSRWLWASEPEPLSARTPEAPST
jgi:hypothetical protein